MARRFFLVISHDLAGLPVKLDIADFPLIVIVGIVFQNSHQSRLPEALKAQGRQVSSICSVGIAVHDSEFIADFIKHSGYAATRSQSLLPIFKGRFPFGYLLHFR